MIISTLIRRLCYAAVEVNRFFVLKDSL